MYTRNISWLSICVAWQGVVGGCAGSADLPGRQVDSADLPGPEGDSPDCGPVAGAALEADPVAGQVELDLLQAVAPRLLAMAAHRLAQLVPEQRDQPHSNPGPVLLQEERLTYVRS